LRKFLQNEEEKVKMPCSSGKNQKPYEDVVGYELISGKRKVEKFCFYK
jgi:hypothetical protein